MLQTELNWLLDDSLAAWARPGGDWRSISWQQLERDLRRRQELRDGACQYLVQLREPLHSLGEPSHTWRMSLPSWGCHLTLY